MTQRPPSVFDELVAVAGEAAALKLVAAHGGTIRHIPARVRSDDHWLVQCVGRDAAETLCAHYRQMMASESWSGQKILVPLGPAGTGAEARRRLAKAIEGGASNAKAARAAGLHERTARRMRRRLRSDDPSQGRLF
jgi:hypothetical protein